VRHPHPPWFVESRGSIDSKGDPNIAFQVLCKQLILKGLLEAKSTQRREKAKNDNVIFYGKNDITLLPICQVAIDDNKKGHAIRGWRIVG
jgi:hypothetical protein